MSPVPGRRPPSILESFNVAFEGIIHVLRTQRNMRIHFLIAAAVLVLALWVGVDKLELIALLLSITFVLMAEMIRDLRRRTAREELRELRRHRGGARRQ